MKDLHSPPVVLAGVGLTWLALWLKAHPVVATIVIGIPVVLLALIYLYYRLERWELPKKGGRQWPR